jgi:hypothetical protein
MYVANFSGTATNSANLVVFNANDRYYGIYANSAIQYNNDPTSYGFYKGV